MDAEPDEQDVRASGASLAAVEHCPIQVARLSLETPGVVATVPMLRGVWGAAMAHLAPEVYETVFEGVPVGTSRVPCYALRAALPDPQDAPAIEMVVFGEACRHPDVLMRAWDVAAGMGLGPARRRFRVWRVRGYRADGTLGPDKEPGPILSPSRLPWPLPAADAPCTIDLVTPVRLLRRGKLLQRLTLPDLVEGAARRLAAVAALDRDAGRAFVDQWTALAHERPPGTWEGERQDVVRYSGRQHREVEMRAVRGRLSLPSGVGPCAPVLAAARWLQVGKGTTVGMGVFQIVDADLAR